MQPEPKINPNSVGCPYCVAGHSPSWRYETQEWVHVVRKSLGPASEHITVTMCTAALNTDGVKK